MKNKFAISMILLVILIIQPHLLIADNNISKFTQTNDPLNCTCDYIKIMNTDFQILNNRIIDTKGNEKLMYFDKYKKLNTCVSEGDMFIFWVFLSKIIAVQMFFFGLTRRAFFIN
ncbi:MAG: hypothetical protein KAH30_02690 [Caldisericia bacterium]|nr:hypothetical protein [Caldisericia bacterium]